MRVELHVTFENRQGSPKSWSASRPHQRLFERQGKIGFFLGTQKGSHLDAAAALDQGDALRAEFLMLLACQLHPEWVEAPFAHASPPAHAPEHQFEMRQHQFLIGPGLPVGDAESDPQQHHIKPEKTHHRQGTQQIEGDGDDKAHADDTGEEDDMALATQRAVRRQPGGKDNRLGISG